MTMYNKPKTHEEIAQTYLRKTYAECGKLERVRVDKAFAMIQNNYRGDGLWGCVAELFTCGRLGRKDSVAGVNENDANIRWLADSGLTDRKPVERKTNGGRLGSFYEKEVVDGCYVRHTSVRAKNRVPVEYIVYSMDTWVSIAKSKGCPGGGKEHRVIEPRVIPVSVFLDFLEANKALKSTNGTNPEIAIQVTSAKLFRALGAWPITYKPEYTYRASDFEDLILEVPADKKEWVQPVEVIRF